MKQALLFEPDPTFTNRCTKLVTFRGKLDLPIHRWYRLTPSFSPALAEDIADHFRLSASDFVLDPFSGVGTVPLCMKYRGIPACSVEINPYLHFVGSVKTRTYRMIEHIERYFSDFITGFRRKLKCVPFKDSPSSYLAANSKYIPKINYPERWWSKGNLAQLVCLRKALMEIGGQSEAHDLLRMGALSILIPVSNAKHNHVSLTYADKPLSTIDVTGLLEQQLQNMVGDLRAVLTQPASEVTIYKGNSKELSKCVARKRPEDNFGDNFASVSKSVQLCPRDQAPFVFFRLHCKC